MVGVVSEWKQSAWTEISEWLVVHLKTNMKQNF